MTVLLLELQWILGIRPIWPIFCYYIHILHTELGTQTRGINNTVNYHVNGRRILRILEHTKYD